jgi:hypothetical protein
VHPDKLRLVLGLAAQLKPGRLGSQGCGVHNVLVKLDCRSRVDITRRAGELGLLA